LILTVVFLTLVTLGALLLILAPARRALPDMPADSAHADLTEDYRLTLDSLRELQNAEADGEIDPDAARLERLRLQGRAARLLDAIEKLPPPAPRRAGPVVRPALLATLAGFTVVVIGTLTFLTSWQRSGLEANEIAALDNALRIPSLARAAQRGGEAEYLRLARATFDSGRFTEAAGSYAEVLRRNPRQPEALRRLGVVLLQSGEKESEAITFITTAARLEPASAEGQLFLGFALSRLGQTEEAVAALERYRTLNPSGTDADDLLATLRARAGTGDVGVAVYRANCASCHGVEGGGGVGPSLRASGLSREANEAVIVNGAAGMPAYPNLKEGELKALLDLLDRWKAAAQK